MLLCVGNVRDKHQRERDGVFESLTIYASFLFMK